MYWCSINILTLEADQDSSESQRHKPNELTQVNQAHKQVQVKLIQTTPFPPGEF